MKRRPKLARLPRLRWLPVANDVVSAAQEAYERADREGGGIFHRLDLRELLDDELERRGLTIDDLVREVGEERRPKLRLVRRPR